MQLQKINRWSIFYSVKVCALHCEDSSSGKFLSKEGIGFGRHGRGRGELPARRREERNRYPWWVCEWGGEIS